MNCDWQLLPGVAATGVDYIMGKTRLGKKTKACLATLFLATVFLVVLLFPPAEAEVTKAKICEEDRSVVCGLYCDRQDGTNEWWCDIPTGYRRCCWDWDGYCGDAWRCDYCDCLLGRSAAGF